MCVSMFQQQLLLNEENRLVHDIERLALDHYLVFINSSRSISTLSIQVHWILIEELRITVVN